MNAWWKQLHRTSSFYPIKYSSFCELDEARQTYSWVWRWKLDMKGLKVQDRPTWVVKWMWTVTEQAALRQSDQWIHQVPVKCSNLDSEETKRKSQCIAQSQMATKISVVIMKFGKDGLTSDEKWTKEKGPMIINVYGWHIASQMPVSCERPRIAIGWSSPF